MAVLVNSSENTTIFTTRDVQDAARTMGLQVSVINAATGREIDEAFARMGRERPDALFVGPDIFFNNRRVQIAILAARYGIPSAFAVRDYVEAGGLMSYGTNINDAYRTRCCVGRGVLLIRSTSAAGVELHRCDGCLAAQTARGACVP